MKLTVLSVGYPLAAAGPDAVGGAEQILSRLDEALFLGGHQSLVIAPADSKIFGTHIPIPNHSGVIEDADHEAAQECTRQAVAATLNRYPVDLVHLHGLDCHAYLPSPSVPALITLHLPPSWYDSSLIQNQRPKTFFNCVSFAQQRDCPLGLGHPPVIENGVPLALMNSAYRPRDYAICLGRICPEKGYHIALDAAREAGLPLYLAGQVFGYEAHQKYFVEEIEPRLDGRRWKFLGPIAGSDKINLLAGARCLVVPSLAAETSCLVALEAMSCGTPVVAFRRGALAETVEDGTTGFLVDTLEQMVEALRKVSSIDPQACRQRIAGRYTAERMSRQYLDLYRCILTQIQIAAAG